MFDKQMDEKLFIRTRGIREWTEADSKYNRCESTPYIALEELFKYYKIDENDQFVDFGCGRGRVAFYVHDRFNIKVSGIELNDITFDELMDNNKSYQHGSKDNQAPLYFEYGYVENYDISREDNIFYFFNPFKLEIFKKVVKNILASVERYPRKVDIIFYYPLPAFKSYLKKKTPFKIINKVRVKDIKDKRGKFIILSYDNTKD